MPRIKGAPYDGRIPSGQKLRRAVAHWLNGSADHVVALTDIYTGTQPPDFPTAADAKRMMREWVGDEPRFHPHVALHDFEAWLLPYWSTIQRLAGHDRAAPSGNPETVNHGNPPSRRIRELFRTGTCRDDYVKPRDAARILRENDLSLAVGQCAELRSLVDTIITVCGGSSVR